ncbi:MAG: hypothetical protein ABJF10_15505 [Chthoniobacter sp.]|uniref:hypothetical protein n=1 Tax=Chthoniobacter sp. TaxID=2510640 RepID=UPI0032A8324D
MLRNVQGASSLFAALLAAAFLLPAPRARAEDAEARAWRMNVPQFELRDASIVESFRALAARSRALDPAHEGINFAWPDGLPTDVRLNLHLVNVPLREAARYVARLAGMRLAPREYALLFLPDDDLLPNVPPPPSFSAAARTAAELILPRVEFRDATLPAALAFLEAAARAVDPRKTGVNVVLDIPPELRDTRITLSLTNLPFGEALRYAATQANLVVVEESYALVVTLPDGTQPPRPDQQPLPGEPASPDMSQWKSRLDKRTQAASPGAARDLSGDIQPEKSGYIPRRSMGGFPSSLDPNNQLDTNGRAK